MRPISLVIQLMVTVYIAKYLSTYALSGQYLFVSILFAGFIYILLSPWKHKFILLSLMIFFPIKFPGYLTETISTIVEILSPIVCVLSVFEILKGEHSLFSRKATLYFIAIGIFTLWLILHYIYNPVLGQITFGVETAAGGLKRYYYAFVGITAFFCSYWFFKINEIEVDRWLMIGLILALIIGNVFIIETFWLRDPYISALFAMGPSEGFWVDQYQSIPLRIIATSVFTLLLSVFHTRKWGVVFLIIFIQALVFLILGGGRANVPAIFLSIGAYVIFINRKHLFPVISALLIISGIYMLFLSNITFSEMKFGRVFMTEGGLEKQSEARYYSFLHMLDIFQSSPVLGKGIGFQETKVKEDFFKEYPEAIKYIDYINAQAGIGGHGAYLSTLSLFGIGGIFWLFVMLYASIFYSYRIIKIRCEIHNDVKLALFAFLYLISYSVSFVVGGTGYTNFKLWFISGIVAGLLSKNLDQDKIELPDTEEKLSI